MQIKRKLINDNPVLNECLYSPGKVRQEQNEKTEKRNKVNKVE